MRGLLLVAVVVTGCATSAPARRASSAEEAALLRLPEKSRERVVDLAQSLVGKQQIRLGGKRYPSDCTGLVRGIFDQLGVDLMREARSGDNGVTAIYRFAGAHGRIYAGGRPVAGDMVFFRETYDLNRDGRVNDGLTHVGLVEQVEPDGTVLVIHRVKRGVVRYRMNLNHPSARKDPRTGAPINDALRFPGRGTETLTGQLFAAYATVLPMERRWLNEDRLTP